MRWLGVALNHVALTGNDLYAPLGLKFTPALISTALLCSYEVSVLFHLQLFKKFFNFHFRPVSFFETGLKFFQQSRVRD